MARLSAADPAVGLQVDEARRSEMCTRVLASQDSQGDPPASHRSWIVHRFPVIAVPMAALIAVGVLAVGGVIGIGKPVERGLPGASLTWSNGDDVFGGPVHLLPVSALNPAGHAPWGIGACEKESNDTCVQPGTAVLRTPGRDWREAEVE
jgi:hypothetical protein